MKGQPLDSSSANGAPVTRPAVDPAKPLSESEKERLAQLEAVVFRNFRAAYEFWAALREIDRKRLYRGTAPTFEKYTKVVFGIAKSQAYHYITAADVSDNLSAALGEDDAIPELTGVMPEPEESTRTDERLTDDDIAVQNNTSVIGLYIVTIAGIIIIVIITGIIISRRGKE